MPSSIHHYGFAMLNRKTNTLLYALSGLFLIGLVRASFFSRLLM